MEILSDIHLRFEYRRTTYHWGISRHRSFVNESVAGRYYSFNDNR